MKNLIFRSSLFVILFVTCELQAQVVPIKDVQGEASLSPLNGQTVELIGQVTGVFSSGYFIRDGLEAWEGVYIYDSRSPMPQKGDSVQISGLVDEYYDFTEIKSVSAFEIISTGNQAPEPTVITADEIGELWESCYVKIENADCIDADLGYGEWKLNDGNGDIIVDDFGVQYTPEVDQNYTVSGPLYYSFEVYKLVPSSLEEIMINAAVFFTKELYPSIIEAESLSFTWQTNVPATSKLMYGETKNFELGEIEFLENVSHHEVVIDGLQAGKFYYVQAYSVFDGEIARSPIQLFSTASTSSGEVKVWFNDPKGTYESDLPLNVSSALLDSVVRFIDSSKVSVDVAMYDLDNHAADSDNRNEKLIDALNAASDRGVEVRFITDDEPTNAILGNLNQTISVLKGNADGIMHNKFLIIDSESVMNSWLITGSTNLNYNNLTIDYNNIIAIQDQAIALAYEIEFEEMWGGSGISPDPILSRFGAEKVDNTPHFFNVGGKPFEVWFSPSDNTAAQIKTQLDSARQTIDFAIMAFTEDLLGNTLKELSGNGVLVDGVIDYVEYSGSEFDKLVDAGLVVLDFKNSDGESWPNNSTVHHKFAVVDRRTENAKVITGSHNWTASANSKHDENTIIVQSQDVASKYRAEIERIKNQVLTPVCRDDTLYAEGCVQVSFSLVENDYIYGENFRLFFEEDMGIEIDENNNCSWYTPCVCSDEGEGCFEIKYYVEYGDNEQYLDSAYLYAHIDVGAVEGHVRDLIKIYPNPARENITISSVEGNQIQSLTLVNLFGQVLMFEEFDGIESVRLNIGEYEKGIYFVKVEAGLATVVKKLVFEN